MYRGLGGKHYPLPARAKLPRQINSYRDYRMGNMPWFEVPFISASHIPRSKDAETCFSHCWPLISGMSLDFMRFPERWIDHLQMTFTFQGIMTPLNGGSLLKAAYQLPPPTLRSRIGDLLHFLLQGWPWRPEQGFFFRLTSSISRTIVASPKILL